MHNDVDYIKLVKKAQFGDEESVSRLAQAVQGRLYAYVCRSILCENTAKDIVQATIVDMLTDINKLKNAEFFCFDK